MEDTYQHAGNRGRAGQAAAILASLLIVGLPDTALGTLEVNVTRVGFPTLQHANVIRSGEWVPIIVDLALVDQPSFDGRIRVGQYDIDGDECYDDVGVHLRAETNDNQRLHLYALANPIRNRGRFFVEVFNEEGDAVQVLSQGTMTYQAALAASPSSIGDDDILILSLSTGTLGRVQDLVGPDQLNLYTRPLHIGHMSPTDLPELWIGLEMIDCIVWEDPRPEQLTPRQISALIEWTRQGGTLLIAASRTAGSLRLTKELAAILPVELGEVRPVDNLPNVRRHLLSLSSATTRRRRENDTPWWQIPFAAPVPVVECTLRDGASCISETSENASNVITRRTLGRGTVLFCAVTLQDLFEGGGSAIEFYQELFHLNVIESADLSSPEPVPLFPHVITAIGFARSGSLYLLTAGVFSVAYVLVATSGVWMLLGARKWRHHCWSAFAVVGLGASVLSVLLVNSVRGFGETLHQISVLDLEAGQGYGQGTVLFGVKTGTDRELDFWLPSDPLSETEPGLTNCFLRPLPAGNDPLDASSSFADPEEYRLVASSAFIDDVRIRGTLKRFEGRWSGPVGGTVDGEIAVRGTRIEEGSYIVNNLDVDMEDCYLLHAVLDISKGRGYRSQGIYAYPIGPVPGGGVRVDLGPLCNATEDPANPGRPATRPTLKEAQDAWGSTLKSLVSEIGSLTQRNRRLALGEEKNALMLLSTIGEHDPMLDAGIGAQLWGTKTWSRDRARQLDLREHLRRDQVVLIGFAEDPGPVRLYRRSGDRTFRPLTPDSQKSRTMYRVRIPVTLLRGGSTDEDEDELDGRIR